MQCPHITNKIANNFSKSNAITRFEFDIYNNPRNKIKTILS